jgi:glutamate racemase
MLNSTEGAIGVFDSGVGGLTVAHAIMERLPHESIIYLGDTARVPYGTKSPDTVIRYAKTCSKILIERGIKLLVIACNTASAHAIPALQDMYTIPVLGVVKPGACSAVNATRNNSIGIIATEGTINSNVYPEAIRALAPKAKVYSKSCPLFVPLAEEGWVQGDVPIQVAKAYLDTLMIHNIDTLVLGCTHYPLLNDTIQQVMGKDVTLVDSAKETARVVEETLSAMQQLASPQELPIHEYLVSDDPVRFNIIGTRFLGSPVEPVEWVDI